MFGEDASGGWRSWVSLLRVCDAETERVAILYQRDDGDLGMIDRSPAAGITPRAAVAARPQRTQVGRR
jgi:hypothetical protein